MRPWAGTVSGPASAIAPFAFVVCTVACSAMSVLTAVSLSAAPPVLAIVK